MDHRLRPSPRIDVDGTLTMWPAPTRLESFWEARADAIVRAALTSNAKNATAELLDKLLRAPPLAREPGEPGESGAESAREPRSKRPSLREVAERHSSRVLLLKKREEAEANARVAIKEALSGGNAAAAPAPGMTAAETPTKAAASAPALRAATAAQPAKKKGSGGVFAGAAIAAMGIAAAFAITTYRDRPTPPAITSAPAPAEARPDRQADPPQPDQAPPPAIAAQIDSPAENPGAPPAPVEIKKAPRSDAAGAPPAASAAPEIAQLPPGTGASPDVKPGQPPEGPDNNNKIPFSTIIGDPPPARMIEESDPNIPQQPSQGALAAAVRPFVPAAKKCVAGADEASRALITFSSNGSVKSVAVTGWAASNGASGCITSALMGANVGPFWKPSFAFPVTIRP